MTLSTHQPAENTNRRFCSHPGCKRIYTAGSNDGGYCPEHRRLYEDMHDEPGHYGVRSAFSQGPAKFWSVIADPSGDFRPGVRFDSNSFAATLRAGFWPDGMIFEHDGTRYTVRGERIESGGACYGITYRGQLYEVRG